MDISQESDPKSQDEIPVRSSISNATSETAIWRKFLWLAYIERPYRASSDECLCLPPIEVSNLLCYLVFTQISSLRPWKVWICTARWFVVSLRQFKGKKSQAKLLWPRWEIRSECMILFCRKCPSQPSSEKIFWKLLTVKQQTGMKDLTAVHLV